MSWVRVDDKIAFHRKTVEAGNEAFGAWVRMVAWCSDHLTDGVVPARICLLMAERQDVVERLCDVGLLEIHGDALRIHDYHDHNPHAADVKAKRAAEAKRKAEGRGNQGRDSSGRITSAPCPRLVRADNPPPSEDRPPVPLPLPDPLPKEKTKALPAPRFDFEAVYNAYPGTGNKAKGIEHLERLVKSQTTYDRVLAAAKRYAVEEQAYKASGSKEFRPAVPHFSTWCNQRRWEDFDDKPGLAPDPGLFPDGMTPHASPATARTLHREAQERGYTNHAARLQAEGRA